MKSFPNLRKLCLESLEERTLLAVMAGYNQYISDFASEALPTEARKWVVNLTDEGYTSYGLSLSEAIRRASTGDEIVFDEALRGKTITLSWLSIYDGITIDASSIGGIKIDASGDKHGFYINSGPSNPVKLIGLTITGGKADTYGGGIYITGDSTVILSDCTVRGNSAGIAGGGIFNDGGALTLTNCSISNNSAKKRDGKGGGIYTGAGTLTLTNSLIDNNIAYDGGGIYHVSSGTVTATNSTVSGNIATNNGGGIYNNGGTLTLMNCTVSKNSATYDGGGIYDISTVGNLTITNSIISRNTGKDGGGIYNSGSTLTLTNCTVARNSAKFEGGGICHQSDRNRLTLYNSIVVLNEAQSYGDDIYTNNRNIAYNTLSSFTGWATSIECYVFDSELPLFTNHQSGIYTLAKNSQAINAGNNAYVTTEYDLDGRRRIVDRIVDLGAYEDQYETPLTVVTTLNDVIDEKDKYISLREAIGYAQDGDVITFDSSLAGGTITLSGSQLEISKNITINAKKIGGICINADNRSRVFYVSGGNKKNPVELISLTIIGGNTQNDYGGGIYNSGTLTLKNCTISENSAVFGGGIYTCSSTVTLNQCTISKNSAYYSGGGVYNNKCNLYMTGCSLSENTITDGADNYGGGGICNRGTLVLTNCNISRNTSRRSGGAIYNTATTTLRNCTITGNSTISEYYSYSGGIYNSSGVFTLYNTIIALNTNGDIWNLAEINAYNSISSFSDWTSSKNCLVYNTLLPIFTDAVNGDYSLVAGSLAIDMGDSSYIKNYGNVDIVGNARVYGETVDIGAYERQTVDTLEIPSCVVTTNLDVVDLTDNLISLREAIIYAKDGDKIIFDPSLSGRTILLNGFELTIQKNISIDASSTDGISISANGKSRVFNVITRDRGTSVEMASLTIVGGCDNYGGGIYNSGTLTLLQCTISGNEGREHGGGIYSRGTLAMTNCAVFGNKADLGGGIEISTDFLTLTNCTITGNTARYGGGVYDDAAKITLFNTIVAVNYSKDDVHCYSDSSLYGYNTLSSFIDWTESSNCLVYDPTKPLFTASERNDYNLTVGSQAINKGQNDYIDETITDIAGHSRVIDETVDIGAYEFTNKTESPSTVVTTPLDIADITDNLISLREAIHYASSGDRIVFSDNLIGMTINLYGGEIIIDKSIIIDATSIGGIVVNGNSINRVFSITNESEDRPVELIGLTITGGRVDRNNGGGIYNSGKLTMTNCTVSGNVTSIRSSVLYGFYGYGGGIYNSGVLTLTTCTVAGNTGSIGGIFNDSGEMVLINSTVSENTSCGISNSSGSMTLTNCTVSENTSCGISNSNGSMILTNCTVSGNTSSGINNYSDSVKLTNDSGSMILTNCTVSGNTSNGNGGGIYNFGTLTMTNCTVVMNSALDGSGGGVCSIRGTLMLIGCTISGNNATDYGGGIWIKNNNCVANLYNTIITQNIANGSGDDVYGDAPNAYNCLSSFTDWTEHDNCPMYDPTMCLFTDPEVGDYSLAENSQAINAGNNTYVTTEIDITGKPRIIDGIVDIGAYEYEKELPKFSIDLLGWSGDYDEVAHSITVSDPYTDTDTILYSADGKTYDLTNIPSYINPGTYTTYVKISRSGYQDWYGSANVEIIPANISDITLTNWTGDFDGSSHSITVSDPYAGTDTILYSTDGKYYNLTENPQYTNVGSYTTYVKVSRFGYRDWYGSANVKIVTAKIDDTTLTGWTGDFDGTAHSVTINDPHASTDTILYSTDGKTYNLTSIPSYIYPGTYTTYVKVSRRGHQDWYGNAVIRIQSSMVTTLKDIVDNKDGLTSLREAILFSDDVKTISFSPSLSGGTITLNGTPLEISAALTIDASDIGGITIDGGRRSSVLHVTGGTKETPIELIGLTITGGHADENGGGIFNDSNSNLVLTRCTVSGNSAEFGGGIYNYGSGTLTLVDSSVLWNSASAYGGGINIDGVGKVTLTDSLVSENSASYGGGVYNNYGTLKMTGGGVTGNNAGSCGGGIYNTGYLTIINSTISDNSAYGDGGYSTTDTGYGGGIYNELTSMELINCTIVRNTAGQDGGAIFNKASSTITNNAILENSASRNGGGIYNSSSNLTLKNNTVSGNSANSYGGGIYNTGTVRLNNSIIALNYYSDIYKSQGRINAYNSLSSFTGWTSVDSLEYDISKPLFTDPSKGDYTLANNSQAIDMGNNSYVTTETDLAGNPRIVNSIVDIGAYEYQGTDPELLTIPTILTGNRGVYVSYGANRHQIQWNAIDNASGYELQYSADGTRWTAVSAAEPSAVVTGLGYGQDIQYRVRALGTGSYTDSDWSEVKAFNVCPMDVNGDGDMSGADRNLLAESWLSEEGDDEYRYYADINGDGDVSGADRNFLTSNWLGEAGDGDLTYPKPAAATDAAFAAYGAGDLDVDFNVF